MQHRNFGNRPVLGLVSAAVIVAVVCGCSDNGPAGPLSTATTSSATAPATLTIAEYQAKLTAVEQAVRPAVERVLAANSLADIDSARQALATVLDQQYADLSQAKPPAQAQGPNQSLLSALDIGTTVRNVSLPSAAPPDSCGISQPLDNLLFEARNSVYSTVNSITLQSAKNTLASLNLKVDSMLPAAPAAPPTPPVANRRAANGQIIQRTGKRGPGRLDINNGTGSDYAVSIVTGNPSNPQVMIYVQANSNATVTSIAGTYNVYLKSGEDWDGQRRGFTRNCSYQKFDDSFDQASDWQISLEKSPLGNAESSTVPPF